ncbi:unnamed protein product [Clonostachys rosea f. rosea IK726]|uniref:Epoxide hydrolase N-terminal domain-containing protein n=2 Tax=Bionectria ochroleuca TaxID=29856 RepID=A0A0B7KK90_BIOOC|nr:unnamed protein product [Clonostachys rosea f. rosea IK726]
MAPEPKPFQISVPEKALQSLKNKLLSSTYFEEVEFADDWDYGAPMRDVKRLARYWADGFDWRAQEAKINSTLPQFTTTVHVDKFGDLEMHFVHQKSDNPKSIPLLFCHGWPGSFLEVEKILPLLLNQKDGPSFHVVAPSLPNFGFSQGASKSGFGVAQYAEAMHKVMINLGYDKYVSQGGDWGYKVTRFIGILFPQHCLASHLNMVLAKPPTLAKHPLLYLQDKFIPRTEVEKAGLKRTDWFAKEGAGYNVLQTTKPSTIGHALADSPVALLAWIWEKLHDWADDYPWTDDEILTWVSIYQFSTAGPAASARIYYEIQQPNKHEIYSNKVFEYNPKVVLGLSYFPQDIFVPPRAWGRTLGPVVFEANHTEGGHFAAHEKPELLAGDLKKMFSQGGGASSVAKRLTESV